jgi:hypothetical protein
LNHRARTCAFLCSAAPARFEGLAVGRIACALAKRFNKPQQEPHIISTDGIGAELGEWARGFALDQRLSGAKARRELGWMPKHLDPEADIEAA